MRSQYLIVLVILFAVIAARAIHAHLKQLNMRRAVFVLMLGIVVVASVAGYFQLDKLEKLRNMRSWPTAPGKIESAELTGDRAIVPHVVYTFSVGDSLFRGTSDLGTPAFGNRSKRLNEAVTLLAEYPVGKDVLVRYDPLDPSLSYILSAVPWNVYMQMGLWTFCSLSGTIVFVIFGFRKSK